MSRVVIFTFTLFLLAATLEIGGAYLIWLWLRRDYTWISGVIGGFLLFLYGVVPTFQPSLFHRTYATYGAFFIITALVWGWIFDGVRPDIYDIVGSFICLMGAGIIFYTPR